MRRAAALTANLEPRHRYIFLVERGARGSGKIRPFRDLLAEDLGFDEIAEEALSFGKRDPLAAILVELHPRATIIGPEVIAPTGRCGHPWHESFLSERHPCRHCYDAAKPQ
ncbi:hypothetical protein BRCON_2576 [Candidatus Sumerlaea chitinivorans]|uniref:Uncharacterized protein n=1 Tax=Sumerlaea chitinivorans TaxID=2250252 RepID=A0A2Z4Y914_SUMC1|nr:hypothetical protein BRCON_2576 [Candidatus Sumerlaea chitinivorans]